MKNKKATVISKASTTIKNDIVNKANSIGSQIMDKATIAQHKVAAKYHEAAAKHHYKVLKHYENGNHNKAKSNAAKAHNFMNLLIRLKDDVKLYVSNK